MSEPGSDLDFAEKALRADHCSQLGVQHLHRDRPPVFEVAREEYACHPATTDLAIDRITIRERISELIEPIDHCSPFSALRRGLAYRSRSISAMGDGGC